MQKVRLRRHGRPDWFREPRHRQSDSIIIGGEAPSARLIKLQTHSVHHEQASDPTLIEGLHNLAMADFAQLEWLGNAAVRTPNMHSVDLSSSALCDQRGDCCPRRLPAAQARFGVWDARAPLWHCHIFTSEPLLIGHATKRTRASVSWLASRAAASYDPSRQRIFARGPRSHP